MLRCSIPFGLCLLPSLALASGGPTGETHAWPLNSSIPVEVGDASAEMEQSVLIDQTRRAFEQWSVQSNTAPRISVAASADTTVSNGSYIRRVSVLNDTWVGDAEALALTTYTYVRSTGEITDADIIINGTGPCLSFDEVLPSHCYDATAIMLHEAGHFIGVQHMDAEESIMFPTLDPGDDSKRKLAALDATSLRLLYPGVPQTQPEPAVAKAPLAEPEDLALRFSDANAAVARAGCSSSRPGNLGAFLFLLLALRLRRNRGQS